MKGSARSRILLCLAILSITDNWPWVHGFVNSPKIISKDGNLIFESGENRNISFRLHGNSRLMINDEYDLLDVLMPSNSSKKRFDFTDEFSTVWDNVHLRDLQNDLLRIRSEAFGASGLSHDLRVIQNSTRVFRGLMQRFRTRLRAVETRANRMKTQLEANNCASGPCENGGTCYNTFYGFRCQCRPAFEGTKCDVDVNECAMYEGTDLGCQNGGQCQNQFGSYSCLCPQGWHGMHCTQRKADCSQSSAWEMCGHGSCVPSSDDASYRCLCEPGWKTNGLTPVCAEDVDECSETAAHTPCSTKCINLPGSFTCAPCPAGLTGNGVSCRDVDECQTNNGGCSLSPKVNCINSYGSHQCGECPVGWTGDGRQCVRDAQESNSQTGGLSPRSCPASNNPCYAGASCFLISGTASCRCPVGMVGSGYGSNGCVNGTTTNCNGNPCLNDGVCLDAGPSNFTCLCPAGFRQPICQPSPSPCDIHPCKNGGRCRRTGDENGFVCQCSPGYRGRRCETRFSSCNGMLSAPSGRLKYPPEGTGYEHNAQCAWVIRTNESLVVNVTFNSFDLEDATECRFDWLQINDGRSAAAQVIGRYCGSHLPHGGNIISSGNMLYIWFRSDNSTAKEGFDLSWNSMEPQCGGRLDFETHGTLASPGSPGNYPKNRDCQWQVVAPTNKRIKLTFFSLQLEQHDSCNFDYVRIKDTISGRELAKYCTSGSPSPLLLPTHQAEIQFHSDAEGSDSGFQLHYSVEERVPGCGGVYTDNEGTISVSTTANSEPGGISCEYEIHLALGELIAIQFMRLEMGPSDCLELLDVTREGDSFLQDKICGSYGAVTNPPAFTSQFNRVKIKFYAAAGQFELHYRMACDFKLDSDHGTITSPGYPNLTRSDRLCTYTIITDPNTVISLKRIDFQLGSDENDDDNKDCLSTNLRINDGLNRQVLGPYCGQKQPEEDFVSTTNHLQLLLTTDPDSTGRGFKFEYRAVATANDKCGGVHTRSGDHIRLPVNSDGEYAVDATCYWVILAPANKVIRLHWISFSMEDCRYDYVEIYDSLAAQEDGANSKPLAKLCERGLPEDLVSHSRQLVIKFVSDSSDSEGGFELSYSFEERGQCGGRIISSSGELTSPDYPANYSAGLDCDWHLNGAIGQLLELQLEIFDLEMSPNCSSDYLEIRNGGSMNSPLIGHFCGRNIPTRIPTYTHEVRLLFHTDSAISGHGFRLRWRGFAFGCGGRLQSNAGSFTSPRYPNPYPNSAHCEWRIRTHPGSAISLYIEDFELESLNNCFYDSVKIFIGSKLPDQNADITICNQLNTQDPLIEIESNEATVAFDSDDSSTFRGFRISFKANCVRNLTAVSGTIESLNFMEPYWETTPINCSWTIRAPKGNHVRLEVSHLEQHEEHMPSARTPSGLYIIDGRNTQKMVSPGSVNASGEIVTVVHNASNVNFQLDYRIDGCSKELRDESGSFRSPNNPNMYPNNLECYWLITVQKDSIVQLTITNLDIEESVNCTKDALTVSNHQYTATIHERHCGSTEKLVLTSSGHRMHVRFFSDGSHNGRGFVATYRTVKASCGGKFSARRGMIQSPNYPHEYPLNTHCEWQVEVSPHHRIVFEIEDLELEMGFQCDWDYLEAFDLAEDDTEGPSLFKVCGDRIPSNMLMSTTNLAVVRFISDYSLSSKGFQLNFHESCGQTITIDETDYDNIEMTRQSPRNESCLWVLQAEDPTKRIIFTPTHVKLRDDADSQYPTEGDCLPVGVKIYEGTEATGTPRLRYCRSHPAALISNGQSLVISVPLQLVEEFEGNYMTMDTACGSLYNSLSGRFSSPYYPASYPPNIECVWILAATLGNSLSLTLESMDMEKSENCNRDYLEVREDSERGELIGVYCGNDVPGAIHSRGSIWIKFKSDDDNVGEGFLASYNYEHHNELNGTDGIIESPHYPSKFQDSNPYSWRITVDKEYVVMITVEHLRDLDQPHLLIYDGYSDIGARIAVTDSSEPIRSSTNVVYFTASRGPFKLSWARLSKDELRSNRTADEQTRLCGQQLVTIGRSAIALHSPGYPNGYENGLNCSWKLVPSNPATHAVLKLSNIDLEVFGGDNECLADYVQISTSSDLQNWSDGSKLCTLPTDPNARIIHGNPYLRVKFITDNSLNKTGFMGLGQTMCGSEVVASKGQVNITEIMLVGALRSQDCVWTLKVRQGRRIKIDFPTFQVDTSASDESKPCANFLIIRNGNDEDSPFLGKGKYCKGDTIDVLETTSNRAYVKFHMALLHRFQVTFRFEEVSHACSGRIKLTTDTDLNLISTPFYPHLPHPHSECVWIVQAPPEHRIMLHFHGEFDLVEATDLSEGTKECQREYVLVSDGATELKPEIGRYCGSRKPDTVYSTGNQLRIRYYTDVTEPHKGFNASLQLARCGGSYYSPTGIIASPPPNLLQIHNDANQLNECVYTVELEKGSSIDLQSTHLNIAKLANGNCSERYHLLLEEINDEEKVVDTLMVCGDDSRHLMSETNKIVFRYRFLDGIPAENQGFSFSYSSVGSRCGETIRASVGVLQTPDYPVGVTRVIHCSWKLEVPKGKRVRLEILDFDVEGGSHRAFMSFSGRLLVANDHHMQSILGRYSSNPPASVVSSDNTMGIDVLLLPFRRSRGAKLRFTAFGFSACQQFAFEQDVIREIGFQRLNISSPTHCSYNLKPEENSTILIQVKQFNTTVRMMNSVTCSTYSPLKFFRVDDEKALLERFLCDYNAHSPGKMPPSIRVPFPIKLTVSANGRNLMTNLVLGYSMQPCGGAFILEPGDNMTVRQPSGMEAIRDAIDCAWAIGPYTDPSGEDEVPQDIQLELSVQVNLPTPPATVGYTASPCEDHYLKVYNGPDQNSPLLGLYCNQSTDSNLVVERGLFLEYHSNAFSPNATFNVSIKYGSGCGGKLTHPYRAIDFSEQYKNNVECIWEVETATGYHIGLTFQGRFYIEDSPGCTKDYLLVQQRNESAGNWTDLQRICGRTPPEMINTTAPYLRLIFRSDADVVGDGFLAKLERNCGGLLYADEEDQQLFSPGYPLSYEKYLECNWTIVPRNPSMGGVLATFIDFDLEKSPVPSCSFDNVTVTTKDKGENAEQAILCGVKYNHNYRAKESINILFQTDASHSGRGFHLKYTSRLCGGIISQASEITSPRQHADNTLPPSSDCYWNLTAPAGHKITIKFELLDFERHTDCAYDGVEVFSGSIPDVRQRRGRFCGHINEDLPIISIPQDRGIIHSYSDDRDPSRGFSAVVRFMPNCDEQISLNGSSRYVYRKFNNADGYEHNLDCHIVFRVNSDQQISVQFQNFHVELSNGCIKDYVELRDGAGPFADSIGRFCGQDQPPTLITTRHTLFLRFFTDDQVNDSGFEVIINAVPRICGSSSIKLSGDGLKQVTINTPARTPGGNYGNGVSCFWQIEGDVPLSVRFVNFDLHEPDANERCVEDYLKIYNGEDAQLVEEGNDLIINGQVHGNDFIKQIPEHVYCGKLKPDTYYANANKVFLKFQSKALEQRAGFELQVSLTSNAERHYGGLQGRVRLMQTTDCDIMIRAPPNHTLSLYYNEVVFATYDCEVESMEVFDRTNRSLQHVCSFVDAGKSLFSDVDELRLHMRTGSYLTTLDLTYLASPVGKGPGCGGHFYNTNGIFSNPFYPANVRNNSECQWTIQVPSNNKVLLSFEVFNLGSRSTCHTDYLTIVEPNDGEPDVEVRRFCGEDNPKFYKSLRSRVEVRFHKTVNYDGVGWVIRFSGVYADYKVPAYLIF
ncbi:cubilin homolog [Drosophila rhopaloa]|uniref:Cubilin homolog n=1 Tax=Drosophila rhopaloa TaxID=1041015 RepID=A0A6P4FM74_DRORH|nr:cubilin homolog [Drosophila rhopaloa]